MGLESLPDEILLKIFRLFWGNEVLYRFGHNLHMRNLVGQCSAWYIGSEEDLHDIKDRLLINSEKIPFLYIDFPCEDINLYQDLIGLEVDTLSIYSSGLILVPYIRHSKVIVRGSTPISEVFAIGSLIAWIYLEPSTIYFIKRQILSYSDDLYQTLKKKAPDNYIVRDHESIVVNRSVTHWRHCLLCRALDTPCISIEN